MMNQIFNSLTERYPLLTDAAQQLEKAFFILCQSYDNNGKLLLCGNGGSASDCEHIVGELLKEFKVKRSISKEIINNLTEMNVYDKYKSHLAGALPAISLVSQTSFMTAFLNDEAPEYLFAQQVYALGNKEDCLLAISTSGNSVNIIHAAIVAKAKKIKVIGLTGENGGKLKDYCDCCIMAPSSKTDQIQEYHLPLYHALCEALESHYFAK